MGKRGRRIPRYQREEAASRPARQAITARPWRYWSAIAVDESKCIPADPDRQHYTVVPETAYYSMQLHCRRCGEPFWFSANEQRVWYEEWGFWIDSVPKHCAGCRRQEREAKGRN